MDEEATELVILYIDIAVFFAVFVLISASDTTSAGVDQLTASTFKFIYYVLPFEICSGFSCIPLLTLLVIVYTAIMAGIVVIVFQRIRSRLI